LNRKDDSNLEQKENSLMDEDSDRDEFLDEDIDDR
jgi:hypothetical protein